MPRDPRVVCLLLATCACSTITQSADTPLGYLVLAEEALEAKDPAHARDLLEGVDEDSFEGIDLERYRIDLARAWFGLSEYYECFETLRDFPRKHPSSDFLPTAEELVFRSGAGLAESGWSFLGLVSDLDRSKRVLEHFLLFYPRSRWLGDCLRILGDAAYLAEDWDLAIERYGELLQNEPGSQWADRAAFRIAMSQYEKLEGPDYDQGAMDQAHRELGNYIRQGSTNEEYLAEARRAHATVRSWLETRALAVAGFYLTVGRPQGAIYRLEALLEDPDVTRADEARALLAKARAQLRGTRKGEGPDR